MRIPVYVVTGFLDSGKTTFLNNLLNRRDWLDSSVLVVQFESGETDFHSENGNCENVVFPKKTLESEPEEIVQKLGSYLEGNNFDEVWIEWNGVEPFSRLHEMLLRPELGKFCKIGSVVHVADAAQLEALMGKSGGALLEQIASSDLAVVRNIRQARESGMRKVKNLIEAVNPGVRVCDILAYDEIYKGLFEKKRSSLLAFLLSAIFLIWLYLFFKPILEMAEIPVNKIVNVFLGIALQAIPFLMIGTLLSSAIEIFVSRDAIERRFPKTTGMGVLTAIAAGFFLPVCDCASIPIFRSLVRKKIPLPAAVAFMMSAPVINPVVILSTYYAFSGNVRILLGRIAGGVISAVIIGLSFAVMPPKGPVSSGGAMGSVMCGCGCFEDAESVTTLRGKTALFLRHAQSEFFNAGKYLMTGIFISSIFQATGATVFATARGGAGLAISMIITMLLGFMLSLCSSSDAIVARSFANQFPLGAVMGFLVFGPMMDIKNLMMLSYGFSKGFIARLLAVSFIVCFAVVFLGSLIY
ncbi:MAG: permease [Synergistaceae bacterium]|jgi:uncharacterized membrane protein YraQ (UPF0718 family)|nr:permease [Synergistaceae bacterium]